MNHAARSWGGLFFDASAPVVHSVKNVSLACVSHDFSIACQLDYYK